LLVFDGNFELFLELLLASDVMKRSLSMKQLVDHQPEGPDISFGAIGVADISLGRHIERRANIHILEGLSKL
jgi:hypothetical protein